ncbi:MAG: hypothetical protein JXB35_16755 [Anaerolineae bacterium]|nr:hypothetical protein [Anaerolineae bacterium]
MESKQIAGLTLYYNVDEAQAAELIGAACVRSVHIIESLWQLPVPEVLRVYVMTGWMQFVFHSAPWHWRLLLMASFPLWALRVRHLWRFAGGWAQCYGKRHAIGIKPPRLYAESDRSLGERIFVSIDDVNQKVQHVTCHELTHGFSSYLKLPSWLNEGLAMVTVDRFAGDATVKPATLEVLRTQSQGQRPQGYRRLSMRDPDALVYHYVRGYWITRYLVEAYPDSLRGLLRERQGHKSLEASLAGDLGLSPVTFWSEIDALTAAWFSTNLTTSGG